MSLADLRQKIDAIDTELLRLLNERAEIVHGIGVIKKRDGLQIYAPEREESLLRSLVEKNRGLLPEKSIRAIYREIMSAALALEEDLKIAYLGPEGTWTHEAAIAKFGGSVDYLPQPNVTDVFDHVARRVADYGVVPIESSTEGAAQHVFDLFAEFPLKICAQLVVPIDICLMARGDPAAIRKIYGHPGVLAACRNWLERQGAPHTCEEVSSTRRAAELAGGDPAAAAVGSPLAASLAGLRIVAKNIQNEDNETRFVVVGRKPCPRTGDDLTSVIVSGNIDTGAVLETLSVLNEWRLHVAQVDSHLQSSGSGRFSFYIEVEGHIEDDAVAHAVEKLESQGKRVTLLGSYPRPWRPE
ncbi:MAG: chorismate mutase [Verrucomicrobiae bacterium]|nr:chorismate mutase [Verrucomicrobiae bacterium]MCP5539461.1 chorismate mutase [Akkermansiaceae bacterium]MCP5551718.1 chorismate mutase [Akkermansiaceae bacterium]